MKRSHLHSQNFIRRPQIVRTLVGHSNLKKSDTVYDIGAGSGVITSVLADICERVVAIEFDPRLADKLHDNTKAFGNVKIINDDFMNIQLPESGYKVFANIPFHLSSPILRKLTEASSPPLSIYLVVQKQFAKKLIIGGSSPFTGLLGAMIAPWFTTKIRFRLEKTDFWPHPAVDTVMIEIIRRDLPLLDRKELSRYYQFIEKCYSRQKYFQALGPDITKTKRPSQLSAEEWVELYHSSSKA